MPLITERTSFSLVAACSMAIAVAVGTGFLGGCTSAMSHAPVVLQLDHVSYDTVFDSAVALAADEGMPAILRDRDGGVIESVPNVSGSLVEPWDWPNGDIGAATESTLTYQRRRVRFEFVPSAFRPREGAEDAPLEGPRLPSSVPPDSADAVNFGFSRASAGGPYTGPIELRVWVYVERAYTPYLQRSTWTFRGRSFAKDPERRAKPDDQTTRDQSVWTPVSRDPAMEEALLTKLRDQVNSILGSTNR